MITRHCKQQTPAAAAEPTRWPVMYLNFFNFGGSFTRSPTRGCSCYMVCFPAKLCLKGWQSAETLQKLQFLMKF